MKVLLAIDASEPSEAAIREVHDRPWPDSSVIRVFSAVQPIVVPPPVALLGGSGAPLMPATQMAQPAVDTRLREQAQAMVDRVAETLQGPHLSVETSVREGDARSAIVEEAKSWAADLIVMGSRDLSGIKRLFLGSVAHSVVNHAPCSVEVVRPRAASTETSEAEGFE